MGNIVFIFHIHEENLHTLRYLRPVCKWFKVVYVRAILRTLHLLWENFYTFRYLRPLRRRLEVVYVWVVLLVHHYINMAPLHNMA